MVVNVLSLVVRTSHVRHFERASSQAHDSLYVWRREGEREGEERTLGVNTPLY